MSAIAPNCRRAGPGRGAHCSLGDEANRRRQRRCRRPVQASAEPPNSVPGFPGRRSPSQRQRRRHHERDGRSRRQTGRQRSQHGRRGRRPAPGARARRHRASLDRDVLRAVDAAREASCAPRSDRASATPAPVVAVEELNPDAIARLDVHPASDASLPPPSRRAARNHANPGCAENWRNATIVPVGSDPSSRGVSGRLTTLAKRDESRQHAAADDNRSPGHELRSEHGRCRHREAAESDHDRDTVHAPGALVGKELRRERVRRGVDAGRRQAKRDDRGRRDRAVRRHREQRQRRSPRAPTRAPATARYPSRVDDRTGEQAADQQSDEQRRDQEAAIREREPELLDGLRQTEHGAGQSENRSRTPAWRRTRRRRDARVVRSLRRCRSLARWIEERRADDRRADEVASALDGDLELADACLPCLVVRRCWRARSGVSTSATRPSSSRARPDDRRPDGHRRSRRGGRRNRRQPDPLVDGLDLGPLDLEADHASGADRGAALASADRPTNGPLSSDQPSDSPISNGVYRCDGNHALRLPT